jgi:hypothetical protein
MVVRYSYVNLDSESNSRETLCADVAPLYSAIALDLVSKVNGLELMKAEKGQGETLHSASFREW